MENSYTHARTYFMSFTSHASWLFSQLIFKPLLYQTELLGQVVLLVHYRNTIDLNTAFRLSCIDGQLVYYRNTINVNT